MNDDAKPPTRQPPPHPVIPVPYASPGANVKSQWITDEQPGGGWLVGCLIIVCGVGAVLGAAAWLVSSIFSGMGL